MIWTHRTNKSPFAGKHTGPWTTFIIQGTHDKVIETREKIHMLTGHEIGNCFCPISFTTLDFEKFMNLKGGVSIYRKLVPGYEVPFSRLRAIGIAFQTLRRSS
jgi:hypothetical protein